MQTAAQVAMPIAFHAADYVFDRSEAVVFPIAPRGGHSETRRTARLRDSRALDT
ncbi:hypothetical protein PQQ86_38485 [Paraburkholderia sediminicola]|uniref:hypothetical protein n=1 Tax=Paraburkholderia sediminicola TaxID=458836 RepID=UPI0038B86B15